MTDLTTAGRNGGFDLNVSSGDYLVIHTSEGKVAVRRASLSHISAVDAIIFDIDGVLIDVRDSIRLVHGLAAKLYLGSLGWFHCDDLVQPDDVDAFKLAGGFNSDWELAYSWLLFYLYKSKRSGSTDGEVLLGNPPSLKEFASLLSRKGGGLDSAVQTIRLWCTAEEWSELSALWDREGVQRIFVEVYSGDLCPEIYGFEPRFVKGPGLIRKDRPILDRRMLPSGVKFGIATGRTAGETRVGLCLHGWSDLFDDAAVVTEDDGFRKPDPRLLELAVGRIRAQRPLYVGDTPDDLITVQRYNAGRSRMVSCVVLTGVGGEEAKGHFVDSEADIVADNVNSALTAIAQIRGGAL